MKYEDIIDREDDTITLASEPVMATMVAEAPKMMMAEELQKFCQKHLDSETLHHLEENNYFLDTQIPFDTLPQNNDEWMRMASEAESSGWVSEESFLNHISQWSRTR